MHWTTPARARRRDDGRGSVMEIAGPRHLSQLARPTLDGRDLNVAVMRGCNDSRKAAGSRGTRLRPGDDRVRCCPTRALHAHAGVLDGGLLMFSVGTARYATVD